MENEWSQFEDNLFSANHRKNIVTRYGYTQAMILTVEDLQKEYEKRKEKYGKI